MATIQGELVVVEEHDSGVRAFIRVNEGERDARGNPAFTEYAVDVALEAWAEADTDTKKRAVLAEELRSLRDRERALPKRNSLGGSITIEDVPRVRL